jgi:hypothetical protein
VTVVVGAAEVVVLLEVVVVVLDELHCRATRILTVATPWLRF